MVAVLKLFGAWLEKIGFDRTLRLFFHWIISLLSLKMIECFENADSLGFIQTFEH